jgi:hypothetical protein
MEKFYNDIYLSLKKLNEEHLVEFEKLRKIETKEFGDIFKTLIDSNNKEIIQQVIDHFPKEMYISSLQFLFGAIYHIEETNPKPVDITTPNVYFIKIDASIVRYKKQSDIVDEIDKNSTELIEKIIETDDICILRKFYPVLGNLPCASIFYSRVNELLK